MDDFTPLNLFGDDEAENASEIKEETLSAETEQGETTVEAAEVQSETEASEAVPETVEADEIIDEESTDIEGTVEEIQPDKFDVILESQQRLLEKIETLNILFETSVSLSWTFFTFLPQKRPLHDLYLPAIGAGCPLKLPR